MGVVRVVELRVELVRSRGEGSPVLSCRFIRWSTGGGVFDGRSTEMELRMEDIIDAISVQ